MSQATLPTEIHNMFASIASRYDVANDVLSLGIHRLWRRKVVKRVVNKLCSGSPIKGVVLDICTGTGDLAIAIDKVARTHSSLSNLQTIGLDFVYPMVASAEAKKSSNTLDFLNADGTSLPFLDSSADVVTISFGIRNIPDISKCLREVKRVLTPGGQLIILEFGQVRVPIFKETYNWYCKNIMPSLGKIITGNRAAYEYLPKTSLEFPAAEKFNSLLTQSGFNSLPFESLMGGLAYIYNAKKP